MSSLYGAFFITGQKHGSYYILVVIAVVSGWHNGNFRRKVPRDKY